MRESEERARQQEITVSTPSGYNVRLKKGTEVYWSGYHCHIQKIMPPYVELCSGSPKSGWTCIKPKIVKIEDLDMFKEYK